MRRAVISSSVVLAAGCAGNADGSASAPALAESNAIQARVSENPPAEPFDVGDFGNLERAPGPVRSDSEPPTAASIAAECAAHGGGACDRATFMSKEAAACIAAFNQLEGGLVPWRMSLLYDYGISRVVWNIVNRLQDDGVIWISGEVLMLDATDGVVVGQYPYTARL